MLTRKNIVKSVDIRRKAMSTTTTTTKRKEKSATIKIREHLLYLSKNS